MYAYERPGDGLRQDQIGHLEALERVKHLSEWQQGELAALRRSATMSEQSRIDILLKSKSTKPADDDDGLLG